MDWGELSSNVSVIVASLAAIVASVTAIYGIRAWRREYNREAPSRFGRRGAGTVL